MPEPRVLVTGAGGFLGSRLVRLLVEKGRRVKALVRPGATLRALAGLSREDVEIAEGDITIGHTIYRALAGCDRMYHVAAVFKMRGERPAEVIEASTLGTRETLEAARRRGLERVVVTSSVAVLGTSATPEPFDETKAYNLVDAEVYMQAKREGLLVAREQAALGLPLTVVLPGTLFGPGDWKPTPAGEGILSYLRWSVPLRFPCSDGGLNVVDVDDCAEGHVLAMERGRVGEMYILGGENVTYRQMFEHLSEITGLPEPGPPLPRRLLMACGRLADAYTAVTGGEAPLTYRLARDYVGSYSWVSGEKAERELGFRARRSARQALTRSVRYYLDAGYVDRAARRRIRLDVQAA